MGILVARIVLTGGPCAGKTTALSRIDQKLTEMGYRVFIIPESATEAINGGIRPFGNLSLENSFFQKTLLHYQIYKENMYESVIPNISKNQKCIIIQDRGTLDGKAYISKNEFNKILKEDDLKEIELMDNYDMVIHMITAADGKPEFYTTANNTARTESVEQAIDLDRRTKNAWIGHSNLKIIDNRDSFADKIDSVLDCIYKLLGDPVPTRVQRKFLINASNFDFRFLENYGLVSMSIEQSYLNSINDNVERRLRKRIYYGDNDYYFTEQIKRSNGMSDVLTNKRISKDEYNKILNESSDITSVIKIRHSFMINNQYFKLDVFNNEMMLLEVEPTYQNDQIIVPNFIEVLEDVTNNPEYQNINISKKTKILKK